MAVQKNLDDLLSSLLAIEVNNSSALLQALRKEGTRVSGRRLVDVLIEEDDYNPAYDLAVREWPLTSKPRGGHRLRVDARRIAAIEEMMRRRIRTRRITHSCASHLLSPKSLLCDARKMNLRKCDARTRPLSSNLDRSAR